MSAANMNLSIPTTWRFCHLGDVVDYGKTEKAEPHEIADDAWILELEDIEKDTSRVLARVTFAERKSKSTKNQFDDGDVLYGKLRPYLNKVVIADEPGYCTTEIIPLRLTSHLDNRYVFYWLKHPSFLDYVADVSHGLNMPRLGTAAGKKAPFILAPLPEQKRIADKLDAVLGRVDTCRTRLDRLPALLKRFRQSVVAAATSGRLTEEWRDEANIAEGDVKTLGEVIKVSSGKALTAKNMVAGGSIPVFGGNGINGYHDEGNVIEETLVIGRVGYYCGCVHMTPQVAWVTDNALIVRHDPTESSKRYLFYALQALDLRTNDAATAQPVISGQKIYSLLLTLPTLPEQTEIVRRVEALFALADRIEGRLAAAQATVARLTPATLAKAFRGELVPQDPDDEPASALLERIVALTDAAPAKKARTKRGRRS